MEELSFTYSKCANSGKGRILTGVFKSGAGKLKGWGSLSKFLAAGFEVFHPGINVQPSVFIQKMKRFSPHVIILLCQGSVSSVKELIEEIKREGLRSMVRIVLYGSSIKKSVREEVHADAYAENEQELFDIVNEIMDETSL